VLLSAGAKGRGKNARRKGMGKRSEGSGEKGRGSDEGWLAQCFGCRRQFRLEPRKGVRPVCPFCGGRKLALIPDASEPRDKEDAK
jgi:rRNA maturation endonuclease Nob1